MLQGLALINIYADDLDAAKRWYADFLGIDEVLEARLPGEVTSAA
jgi:catechol 2,3-dioxygenase-like lactoylglutathione lyase family enzyme